MELIMGCLLLLCFYCLSREAAAVSARMSQKKVIVVDCGHGGIDPGMIGIDGLKEKEFNLAIGMKLKKALEDYGYQVVMTRETDTGLYDEDSQNKKAQDMQKRILLIQKVDPVLTVSIHQNSYEECGFLTNPEEAASLSSEEYQEKVAQAIADGVKEYIEETL